MEGGKSENIGGSAQKIFMQEGKKAKWSEENVFKKCQLCTTFFMQFKKKTNDFYSLSTDIRKYLNSVPIFSTRAK